jgi:hypothetical protein
MILFLAGMQHNLGRVLRSFQPGRRQRLSAILTHHYPGLRAEIGVALVTTIIAALAGV